jgi:hypothetical protein
MDLVKINWAWATCITLVICAIAFSPGNCSRYDENNPTTIKAKTELVEKQIELEKLRQPPAVER